MNDHSITLHDGICSPVSPARRARVRFNLDEGRWEMSMDASAYFPMRAPTRVQLQVLFVHRWTHYAPRASFVELTEDQAMYLYDAGWRFATDREPLWMCDGPPRPFRGHASPDGEIA